MCRGGTIASYEIAVVSRVDAATVAQPDVASWQNVGGRTAFLFTNLSVEQVCNYGIDQYDSQRQHPRCCKCENRVCVALMCVCSTYTCGIGVFVCSHVCGIAECCVCGIAECWRVALLCDVALVGLLVLCAGGGV